jgi:hypothetical protein
MFNKILSFFKPPVQKEPLVKFKTLDETELINDHPNALGDLLDGTSDGFLIKNFLSKEEVDKILSNFHKVIDSEVANVGEGFTYPQIFAEINYRIREKDPKYWDDAIDDYFKGNQKFKDEYKQEFGVDLSKKLDDLFSKISNNRPIKVPVGTGGKGIFPFGTYRFLKPKDGILSVHCGNYFQSEFLEIYKELSAKVMVEDQLSYFIVLNKAEIGGQLSLFNLRWKEGQTKPSARFDEFVILPSGKKLYVDDDPSIEKMQMDPEPGDMILFQGGKIWHRVERIFGEENRITFGGFMGFSYDLKEVYYWS